MIKRRKIRLQNWLGTIFLSRKKRCSRNNDMFPERFCNAVKWIKEGNVDRVVRLLLLSCIVATKTIEPFEIVADRHFIRAERLSAAGTASCTLLLSFRWFVLHLPHHPVGCCSKFSKYRKDVYILFRLVFTSKESNRFTPKKLSLFRQVRFTHEESILKRCRIFRGFIHRI